MRLLRMFCLFTFSLSLISISCQKDNEVKIPTKTIEAAAKEVTDVYLGLIPSEGIQRIVRQADHFVVGEIVVGEKGLVYQYQPIPGFEGTDEVIIEFQSGTGSGELELVSQLRIVLIVTD